MIELSKYKTLVGLAKAARVRCVMECEILLIELLIESVCSQ